MFERLPCPCCRHLTLSRRAKWDVCPVCGWEDDPWPSETERSGRNGVSLVEARRNFLDHGAITRAKLERVRAPLPQEFPLIHREQRD